MSSVRLLVVAFAFCASPLVAQTPTTEKNSDTSLHAKLEMRDAQTDDPLTLVPPREDRQFSLHPDVPGEAQKSESNIAGKDPKGQDDKLCYSMRSYRVKRENKDSDITRPAGYSTCQPAKRFQMRSTEQSTSPHIEAVP